MDSSNEHTKNLPSPRKGLQGPKPPRLKVSKNSCKIKKQPVVVRDHYRPPVIIYLKSPEVIHVEARNFMNMVQQLTGSSSSSLPLPSSADGGVECNSTKVITEKIDGELGVETNAGVDHMLLTHDHMCSLGLPSLPLQPSSFSSFFPSPNGYPDFYDFDMINGTPYYQDSTLGGFFS